MSDKLRFILGIHCHQPVGNFDHVFEHGYKVSYRPFLETLARFPRLKVALHYSGPLLEWLSEKHPDFFSLIKELKQKGQVEITGGGHYEPILPVIPRPDSLGQLRYASYYLKKQFGVEVRGAWLTERIWEPSLPELLARAGLEYTTVDDFHFQAAGYPVDTLHGYYLSEYSGSVIKIFPISQRLRYLVPFHPVEEVLEFFRRKKETLPPGSCLVLADDGEKFGMWPGTHDWVYRKGWLERFLTALTDAADWLETVTFSQVLDSAPPTGQIYLPSCSYFEMGGWSLPARAGENFFKLQARLEQEGRFDELAPFLRGGIWPNFLLKYPESGWMHKRMYHTSRLVHDFLGAEETNLSRLPEPLRLVWMAQCNCAYWHGIFGGLYLPHLRHAIFNCLIKAERLIARKTVRSGKQFAYRTGDLDFDGRAEIELANDRLSLFVKPSRGGSIVELDDHKSAFNLIDTLARRREAYHYLMEQAGRQSQPAAGHASIHERAFEQVLPADSFTCDPYPRWMLREHFFDRLPESHAGLSRGEPPDLGDFADSDWDWKIRRPAAGRIDLFLSRRGLVRLGPDLTASLALTKRIGLTAGTGSLDISHRLENTSGRPLKLLFGVSFNLTVLGPADPQVGLALGDGRRLSLAEGRILEPVREFTVFNRREGVNLKFSFGSSPALIASYPVETVSQSESGIDRTYQASCLLPVWPVELKPGSAKKFNLTLALSN